MGCELHWEARGVVKRYFGHVDSEELLAPVISTEADLRFEKLRFVINDFLEAQSVSYTPADIETIAAHDIGAASVNADIKVAVVTTLPDIIELAQHYEKVSTQAYPMRIFSTMAEARAWVAEPLERSR